MAEIASLLLTVPPSLSTTPTNVYDKEMREKYIKLSKDAKGQFMQDIPEMGHPLTVLDPAEQSLAYLLVLNTYIEHSRITAHNSTYPQLQPGQEIFSKAIDFLKKFDPIQVRYAGQEWRNVVEYVQNAAMSTHQPLLAVEAIQNAIIRLDPSGVTFTSTHRSFAYLCLHARSFKEALPVLDNEIYLFPTASDTQLAQKSQMLPCSEHESSISFITIQSGLTAPISYRECLEYFLYGAMIYMTLKKWDRASHFLEIVICAPAPNSLSKIMVEAYKKWILVSLISKGEMQPIPKFTSPKTTSSYSALAKPYEALAEVFRAEDTKRLQAEARAGEAIWRQDLNSGLVRQVLTASHKFAILSLEKIFTALSVPEVSRYLQTAEAETTSFISHLISTGELSASLTCPSPSDPAILRFNYTDGNSLEYETEARFDGELVRERKRLARLTQNVSRSDVRAELSKEYIDQLKRATSRKSDAQTHSKMLRTFGEDEDMMDDL